MGIPVQSPMASGKLKIFLGILLAAIVVSSVTTGALMYTMMKRLDATEQSSDEFRDRLSRLESSQGLSSGTTLSPVNDANLIVIADQIKILDDRVSKVEADGIGYHSDLNALNSTTAELAMETKIIQLEMNKKTDRTTIEGIQTNLTKLEADQSLDRAKIDKHATSLVHLQANISSQSDTIDGNILSIMNITATLESDGDTIAHLSDRTASLESSRQSDKTTIAEYSWRLTQLEDHRNVTDDLLQNSETRVSYIEDGLVCVWGNWTTFSKCTADGTQYRERICESDNPDFNGLWCSRNEIDIQSCNPGPVNGSWGDWSSFSNCSQPCGGGNQTRHRLCDSPRPSYGGQNCPGYTEETQTCNENVCPVDGGWGDWIAFSSCSESCGGGNQTRVRVCDSPSPAGGGATCSGVSEEAQACNTQECFANGNWGEWSSYGDCSQPCGGGTQTRQRFCDNPAPAGGGAPCSGGDEESQACNPDSCPVDCAGAPSSDGIFWISPRGISTENIPVYCEFHFDGPWTVIQRRIDGSEPFYRDWDTYKAGFGNISGEYWLGNEAIHHLTTSANYRLKIRLTDWDGVTKFATYSTFEVSDESDQYRLNVDGYSGDIGRFVSDLFGNHIVCFPTRRLISFIPEFTDDSMSWVDGSQFSTYDVENDIWSHDSCAILKRAAWWFSGCGDSSLNGEYFHYPTIPPDNFQGILWKYWHGLGYSLKATAMMVQRN